MHIDVYFKKNFIIDTKAKGSLGMNKFGGNILYLLFCYIYHAKSQYNNSVLTDLTLLHFYY